MPDAFADGPADGGAYGVADSRTNCVTDIVPDGRTYDGTVPVADGDPDGASNRLAHSAPNSAADGTAD